MDTMVEPSHDLEADGLHRAAPRVTPDERSESRGR